MSWWLFWTVYRGGLCRSGRDDWAADVTQLTDTSTVVYRQEPVGVAIAAAVRELSTRGGRHVVEVALFDGPTRTGLRRQLTDVYSVHIFTTVLTTVNLVTRGTATAAEYENYEYLVWYAQFDTVVM